MIPYILAIAGGYLLGSSSKKYVDGGGVKSNESNGLIDEISENFNNLDITHIDDLDFRIDTENYTVTFSTKITDAFYNPGHSGGLYSPPEAKGFEDVEYDIIDDKVFYDNQERQLSEDEKEYIKEIRFIEDALAKMLDKRKEEYYEDYYDF